MTNVNELIAVYQNRCASGPYDFDIGRMHDEIKLVLFGHAAALLELTAAGRPTFDDIAEWLKSYNAFRAVTLPEVEKL